MENSNNAESWSEAMVSPFTEGRDLGMGNVDDIFIYVTRRHPRYELLMWKIVIMQNI